MITRSLGAWARTRCLLVAVVATGSLGAPAQAAWSSSAAGNATAMSTTLAPPTGLAAACGGGIGGLLAKQVRLTWSASATASLGSVLYEVRWGTSPGTYTSSATTSALVYDTPALSGSLGGITYYFVVRTSTGAVWRSADAGPVSRTIFLLTCS